MSALTLTREEAARFREAARARHLAAELATGSCALSIARNDVRGSVLGRFGTTYAAFGDELLVLIAAEHEAMADWQDAREMCGYERMRL